MIKKIIAFLCVFLCLFHCSCLSFLFDSEEEKKKIREDFSAFYTKNDVVFIYSKSSVHFNSHSLDLYEVLGIGYTGPFSVSQEPTGGFWCEQNKIYFSTKRVDNFNSFSLLIYECDFMGNNLNLIYEKNNYRHALRAKAIDGVFYISHETKNFDSSSRQIDTYDLSTGEYTSAIAIGENCSLEDYTENATWDWLGWPDCFEIILPGETESIILDDDFIHSTIYADAMNKYGCSPHKWGIVDGRVLLVYRLWEELEIGDYPHVVFEYDTENHTIEYKMIGFWGDDISEDDFYFIK